ncbi:MAG: hypothetical protein V4726_02105 [Verrucomicrobiota bacterium]
MNAFGFFIARIAWQVGVRRERFRWNAVTRETQMLAETQDMLGRLAWPSMGSVEMMSGEYWQLRDFHDQQDELRATSERLTRENEEEQERLYLLEDAVEDEIDVLRKRKQTMMAKATGINEEVESIKIHDAETRRRFGSLKSKLDVLKKQSGEGYEPEIERTRTVLAELKDVHSRDLEQITRLENEMKSVEEEALAVDGEIYDCRARFKADTAELVAEIGRRSKQIAEISAKIGSLETHKNELAFQMGQFLSSHIDENPEALRPIMKRFGPLVDRIQYLRRSIHFNQRLARRSGR